VTWESRYASSQDSWNRESRSALWISAWHNWWSYERKELFQLSSILDIMTWETREVSSQYFRYTKLQSACWCSRWSLLVGTWRKEFVSFKAPFRDWELEESEWLATNSWNVKLWNAVSNKAMVTTSGHICERWRKELVQPRSISGIVTWSVETLDHTNAEFLNAKMPKWRNVYVAGGHHRWSRKWKDLA
jgi:hypothetical protein